jgi:hypothetical protein
MVFERLASQSFAQTYILDLPKGDFEKYGDYILYINLNYLA